MAIIQENENCNMSRRRDNFYTLIEKCKGPSNKFIFRATYGNSIVSNIFPA
jgi:hypothetical protein